jgi:hypothetical protein
MTNRNPAQSTARHARRGRRLGDYTCCIICGFDDLSTLIMVDASRLPRSVLDDHHVVGRVNSDATVPLCPTCHRRLTDGYLDEGISMLPQPTLLHQVSTVLRSLAKFCGAFIPGLNQWAGDIDTLISNLDATFPGWRKFGRPRK